MGLRTLCGEDSGPLLAMWNATARFDVLTPDLLRQKTWDDPGFDPSLALICEREGEMAGFAMGVLRPAPEGPRGIVKLLAAAAGHRRRGIGEALLTGLERGLGRQGAVTIRVCESAPNYLTPGVDSRYSAAPFFFENQGYTRIGEACNMTVDLEDRAFASDGAERELESRGITLRRARRGDHDALNAFLSLHWPAWVPEVAEALGNRPATVFLALRGGRVVAFSAYDANNQGTGWFGPMGTDPSERGQGIGQVLLFRCLSDIALQGHRYATIPWVDPVDFYRACAGAAVSRIFNRYEKVLKP